MTMMKNESVNYFTLMIYLKEMVSRGSSYKSAVNDNSRKTSATLVPITPDFASRKSRALSAPYLSPPLSPIYDKRRNNSSDTGKLLCFSTEIMIICLID